jgi:hypothetical protein
MATRLLTCVRHPVFSLPMQRQSQLKCNALWTIGREAFAPPAAPSCQRKVIDISLISNGWYGQVDQSRPSSFTWPTHQQPPDWDWNLWRRQTLQSRRVHATRSRVLKYPVKPWTRQPSTGPWVFSQADERLYRKQANPTSWPYYSRLPGQPSRNAMRQFTQELSCAISVLPVDLELSTIDSNGNRLTLTGHSP